MDMYFIFIYNNNNNLFSLSFQAPMVGTLDNTLVRLLIPECMPITTAFTLQYHKL